MSGRISRRVETIERSRSRRCRRSLGCRISRRVETTSSRRTPQQCRSRHVESQEGLKQSCGVGNLDHLYARCRISRRVETSPAPLSGDVVTLNEGVESQEGLKRPLNSSCPELQLIVESQEGLKPGGDSTQVRHRERLLRRISRRVETMGSI